MSPFAKEDVLDLELGNLLINLLEASGSSPARLEGPSDFQMRTVAELLLDNMAEPPRLSDVAHQFGMSPVSLVRAFKRAYGLPPFEWLNLHRVPVESQMNCSWENQLEVYYQT